jgi:hypothetical protein
VNSCAPDGKQLFMFHMWYRHLTGATNSVISHEWRKIDDRRRKKFYIMASPYFSRKIYTFCSTVSTLLCWRTSISTMRKITKLEINVRENRRAIRNWQSKDTGNIGYTRHGRRQAKTKTQHRKLKRWTTWTPSKTRGQYICYLPYIFNFRG